MGKPALRRARGRKESSTLETGLFLEVMAGDVGGLVLGHLNGRDRVALLYCLNKTLVRAVLQHAGVLVRQQLRCHSTLPIAELIRALIAFRRIGGLVDKKAPLLDSVFLIAPSNTPAQTQLQPLVEAGTAAGVSKLILSNVVLRARCTRSYSPLTVERALADLQAFTSLQTLELFITQMRGWLTDHHEPLQLAALSALPCLRLLSLFCSLSWGAMAIQVPALQQLRTLDVGVCGPVTASVFFQACLPALTEFRVNTRHIADVTAFSPDALPALRQLAVARSPPACQPELLQGVELLQLHSNHPVRSRRLAELAAALPALKLLMLPPEVLRCCHDPLSAVGILVLDLATEEDLELFCNRLHIFPNLVRLYLNRLQVEVRGSLRERVVGALRCQQPYAGVDTMEVELPEPFDDDDLEFWEV